MRLDINLATRPYKDARRFWVQWGSILSAVGLLTLILVFMALSGLWSASNDRKTIRSYQKEIAERDSERAKAEAFLNLPENRSTRDRSQFLNELIRRKSFSLDQGFRGPRKDHAAARASGFHSPGVERRTINSRSRCRSPETRANVLSIWFGEWNHRPISSKLRSTLNRSRRKTKACLWTSLLYTRAIELGGGTP